MSTSSEILSKKVSISCSDCEFIAENTYVLANHLKKKHKDEFPFRCPHPRCIKKYGNISNFKYHLSAHEKSKSSFKCGSCEFTAYSKRQLTHHYRQHHNDIEGHKCSLCPRAFRKSNLLADHLKRVHEVDVAASGILEGSSTLEIETQNTENIIEVLDAVPTEEELGENNIFIVVDSEDSTENIQGDPNHLWKTTEYTISYESSDEQ